MKYIEPVVKEIFHDMATQYLIQQELQDIYDCIDKIKQQPTIVYMSQEALESLEDNNININQEEFNYEDI